MNRKRNSKDPIMIVTKFPATVMVLGLISDRADVIPSHSPECNTQAYHLWSVC